MGMDHSHVSFLKYKNHCFFKFTWSELKLRETVSSCVSGVKKWEKKCDEALKHQETISVKAWVKAMDSRITSLGGEGVERFLGNLFRAFDGLFESSSLPPKAAGKAVTIMQRVRQIKAVCDSLRSPLSQIVVCHWERFSSPTFWAVFWASIQSSLETCIYLFLSNLEKAHNFIPTIKIMYIGLLVLYSCILMFESVTVVTTNRDICC